MDFQSFFLFFPTKAPLQLNKTSFTVSGKTHWTPNKPKTKSHIGALSYIFVLSKEHALGSWQGLNAKKIVEICLYPL